MTEHFVDQKKYQYLRCEQQRNILAYIMILKIKNYDVITKVRGCTYGRNQRNQISKEDTSSQTVYTERLVLP